MTFARARHIAFLRQQPSGVDRRCQIWPIRGYTRFWYTVMSFLKLISQAFPRPLPQSLLVFFPLFRSLYFSLALHYLNAWNRLSISPLFGLRDPLKGKPASSNRFDSVKRLSVAKRLLLWQKSQVVEKRESLKNGGVQSEISSISRSCLRTGTSSRCNGRHNFKLPGSRSICSMKIIEEAVGIRKKIRKRT